MMSTIDYLRRLRNTMRRITWLFWCLCITVLSSAGCGTTTQRLATEQLLMSDAVDMAISQIDFSALRNQSVYLDTTYVRPVKGLGFVNADYIISSLRQQLTAAHCLVQEEKETADIIVEPRVGALGTNGHEVTYGVPQTSAISSAAAAFASSPIVPSVPEVSLGRMDAHSGIAKIIVFAFEKESKRPIWQSGVAKAESDSNNTWVLGAGPFEKGSIHDNVRFAGKRLQRHPDQDDHTLPEIRYDFEHVFQKPASSGSSKSQTAISTPEKEATETLEKDSESEVRQADHEDD